MKNKSLVTIILSLVFLLCNIYSVYAATYEYDALGRLIRVDYNESKKADYSYDAKIHKDAINLLFDIKMLNPDYLRIKIVDIFPPFTMYDFNAGDINQLKMYIWFTPIYLPAIQKLGFKLTGKQDKELCQMFIEQFNILYNSADSEEIVNKY